MHADHTDIVSQPDLTKGALDYNIRRVKGVASCHVDPLTQKTSIHAATTTDSL